MRINYFSDIHLEFGLIRPPKVTADIIIAAGDIGIHTQGIEWLKSFNRPVIYIAGNHEFYHGELTSSIDDFREACTNSQIYYLENDKLLYQGVRFLGCTLWANLFAEGDEKAQELGISLNDFKRIKYYDDYITPMLYSQRHQRSLKWLKKELAKPFIGKTVVVTHHAPTSWSWNRSPNDVTKLAYCNDLKHLMYEYEVSAWFHGHIHSIADYRIADSHVFCNPRGYHGRRLVDGFDVNRVVDI